MEKTEVVEKLIAIHRHDQNEARFDDAEKVTPSCRPLVDLKGFDSPLISPIVRRLARELGHPLAKGQRVKNIYRQNGKKLSIEEIAQRFIDEYAPKECKV